MLFISYLPVHGVHLLPERRPRQSLGDGVEARHDGRERLCRLVQLAEGRGQELLEGGAADQEGGALRGVVFDVPLKRKGAFRNRRTNC